MPDIKVPYPVGGINDNFAHDAQPPLTTREAQNERSVDPVSNRIRGGQRAGLSRFCSTRLGAGAVRAVQQVTHDARQTDFTNAATSTAGDLSEFEVALSNGESCSGVVHDSQGNEFALDGKASISKLNRDGSLVYTFAFPVQDESHIVRALAIDSIDRLYVGVSEGSSQDNAWIRCYAPDAEQKLVKVWELRPKVFTEQIVVSDDKLYAAVNQASGARAYYIVYEGITRLSGPDVGFVKNIPYPVNDLDVKSTGDVLTAHGPRTGTATDARYFDPRVPTHSAIFDEQRWNPTFLDSWDERKYIWMSASDLGTGENPLSDGDEVNEWRDTRGRGIAIFRKDTSTPTAGTEFKAPRYRERAIGYKPGVQFDGDFYRLVSDASIGNTESANDFLGTLLPGRGKGYLICMVVQLAEDSTKIGRLFGQANSNTSGARECYINAVGSASAAFGTGTAGAISVRASQRGSPPANTKAPSTNGLAGYATNANSAAIITILCDNNTIASPNNISYMRVNGAPVTRWAANQFWTDAGLTSVIGCNVDGTRGPTVTISDILVLQSFVDPEDSVERVATCPDVTAYDDATNGNYGALDSNTVGTADDGISDTEVERIEGYFAWNYGLSHLLDDGAKTGPTTGISWPSTGASSLFMHAFTSATTSDNVANELAAPPNPGGRDADNIDVKLLSNDPLTVKWSAARGNPRWVAFGGGMGYAVKSASDEDFFTVGPKQVGAATGANVSAVRKLRDNGSSVTNRWNYYLRDSSSLVLDYAYAHPRIAVDKYDNLYVPFNCPTAGERYSLLAFESDGDVDAMTATAVPWLAYKANTGATVRSGRCVSVDPRQPDYTGNATVITRPEFVALGLEVSTTAATSLHKVRLVNAAPNNAAARLVTYVGAINGDIVRFDSGGGALTVGAGSLASGAKYIATVNAYGKVFFADGVNYVTYDPKDGTVARWKATDGGSIVPRYKLLTAWRGRMVLARGDDDPQNWQMSEAGNPFGWDFFPPDSPVATQAVIGNQAEIGLVPDVVTTLIPYDRDRLIFGCDHTIYMMWGDPMENGSIVLVSDITGMAFGSSWAKDSDGLVYFFGSRGGVYVMSPNSGVRKLSSETIDRRLQDVDLAAYLPTLVWDEDLRELRVFLCARTTGSVTPAHWAWCKRTNSWHQDKFSIPSVQPTSVAVFDSDDPDDRVVAIGCEDGYVRKVDRDAVSDDGYTIDSYVTIGPFSQAGGTLRLRDPRIVLARDQQGVRVELGGADTADALFTPQVEAELIPGDNPRKAMGVRDSYCWMRLRNAAPNARWSYESGTVGAYPAGRRVTRDG